VSLCKTMSHEDQPRNENGQFVRFNNRNAKAMFEDDTIGVYDADSVSPAIEFVNVSTNLLEDAIELAQEHDGMVRMGVISRVEEDDDGKNEMGIVFLKGEPGDSEVVAVAGKKRMWSE